MTQVFRRPEIGDRAQTSIRTPTPQAAKRNDIRISLALCRQPRTLRPRVGGTTIGISRIPPRVIHTAYGILHTHPPGADDGLDAIARAAAGVPTRIDTVTTDATFRIDTYSQHEVRGNDTGEDARRGDHAHNDHLQPRGLNYA
jgi:hypothetical protein